MYCCMFVDERLIIPDPGVRPEGVLGAVGAHRVEDDHLHEPS